jgi:hypothetical protein
LEAEVQRAAIPSLAVTRAAAGVRTRQEGKQFQADLMVDLLTGALTPREAHALANAVEARGRAQ